MLACGRVFESSSQICNLVTLGDTLVFLSFTNNYVLSRLIVSLDLTFIKNGFRGE